MVVARAVIDDGGGGGDGEKGVGGKGEAGKSFEDLFQQELKRRGIDEAAAAAGKSASSPSPRSSNQGPRAPASNPFSSSAAGGPRDATRPSAGPGAPAAGGAELGGQRERSLRLVSEGLDGLPGRAKQLLLLGGSVFLGFLPAMLVFSLVFTGIFSVFGENFLHGGRTDALPRYVDPGELLAAPTVDRFVPFRPDMDL